VFLPPQAYMTQPDRIVRPGTSRSRRAAPSLATSPARISMLVTTTGQARVGAAAAAPIRQIRSCPARPASAYKKHAPRLGVRSLHRGPTNVLLLHPKPRGFRPTRSPTRSTPRDSRLRLCPWHDGHPHRMTASGAPPQAPKAHPPGFPEVEC